MTLSKSEMTTKPQENSNTGEMNQQAHITESASNVKCGPKPKFQTKICDHWRRSGSCSYGDSCWYAHGEDDLRKVSMYRSNRITDENPISESDRNGAYGNIYRAPSMTQEDLSKESKNQDEFKAPLPPKRASTNVKGLTVNIPQNITFKEQAANASMPLSPAQERWISMSNNAAPTSAVDKSNEALGISSSSSTALKNGFENELDKMVSGEKMFDRRVGPGKFFREDDADDYGFLSPNPFSYPTAVYSNGNSHVAPMNTHQRSFSRVPHQRNFTGSQFDGLQSHQTAIPTAQEQVRVSRPMNISNGYNDRHFPSQKSSSNSRLSREIPQMNNFNGTQPQLQQSYWNIPGELCQQQKDIDNGGLRGCEQQNIQTRDSEMNRVLSKLKMKDLPYLRYILDRADRGSNERDAARQTWNELINNGSQTNLQPPTMPPQFNSNNTGFARNEHNGSECACRSRLPKISAFDASLVPPNFTQSHPPPNLQNYVQSQTQHHHQQQHQYLLQPPHQHMVRHPQNLPLFGRATIGTELAAPPKIFESLLPSDENFSIWLDKKPKNEADVPISASEGIDHSISGASLLTKMDVLRSEKFPISEEDMESSHGSGKPVSHGKRTDSECSSPAVLSLMELLSSENLLDEPIEKPATTMFDFDTLKIAETLRSEPNLSGRSSETGSIKKTSPGFFFVDDKTPLFDESYKQSGLFTPSTAKTPSFMEQCDFFAAAGTCPFGDACNLSHSVVQDQEKTETLQN